MADFGKGDRIVKMSGVAAGRYGTVNGVRDDGTLNVTFDGERLPRYCDPMRCGKVAANATFKKGDRVKLKGSSKLGTVVGGMGTYIGAGSLGRGSDYPEDVSVRWDSYKFDVPVKPENLVFANSCARNATGDQVIATSGKYRLVYNPLNEGYWFYVGDYGEGMSDVNGRSIFGKDKKSVAMAEFKRLVATANSRATNAKFKVGDKVKFTVDGRMQVGTVLRVYGGPHDMYDVKVGASTLTLADTPIFAANRDFAPGDKVCIGGRAGMERGEKVETIERVEGEGRDKFLFFKGSKWGRPARMYAYANACAKNASADEATARRDIEQSLRKMADFAAGFTGAKASATPTHGDYHLAGYIDLKFPDGDKADAFNPYYLINELNGNKSVLPKWAWGVGGFSYERRGSAWRINVGRFST